MSPSPHSSSSGKSLAQVIQVTVASVDLERASRLRAITQQTRDHLETVYTQGFPAKHVKTICDSVLARYPRTEIGRQPSPAMAIKSDNTDHSTEIRQSTGITGVTKREKEQVMELKQEKEQVTEPSNATEEEVVEVLKAFIDEGYTIKETNSLLEENLRGRRLKAHWDDPPKYDEPDTNLNRNLENIFDDITRFFDTIV